MGDAAANISKALELKEQGNEHFKAGNYKKAMVSYHEIFMFVHGFSEGSGKNPMPGQTTQPVSSEQMAVMRELKFAHFSNLAMCHLKQGNVEKARDNCTKALAIDPANVKALFRRGKCYSQLGALDEAKADLEQVLARDPDNREVLREMQMLRSRFAVHKKKEAKRFAGFFDKLQAEEPAAEEPEQSAAPPPPPPPPHVKPLVTPPLGSGGGLHAPGVESVVADDGDDEDSDIGEALGEPQAFEPHDVSIQR